MVALSMRILSVRIMDVCIAVDGVGETALMSFRFSRVCVYVPTVFPMLAG